MPRTLSSGGGGLQSPPAGRLAKRTRDLAVAHLRSFGAWGAVHRVQVFDVDTAASRVADGLASTKAGALVIFFGRGAEECDILAQALGVRALLTGSSAIH